ncbi:nonribosomal peptide synthetase 30-like [Vespula squamosa]|uniref:Nonribosomal peptide synthetase 30-like n=1 Tax=Vespula squamosa TaxID=30214 RepID=A0ABD2B9S5_VESSQ
MLISIVHRCSSIDVITEETYIFAEIFDRTVTCVLQSLQQGIKVNDMIAVCIPNITKKQDVVKLFRAKIVFADENSVDTILEATKLKNYDIKVVVFGKSLNALPFSNILEGHIKYDIENFQCTNIDNVHDTAGLLYSSGTTGLPKGVRISHFALLSNVLLSGNLNTEGIPLWLSPYFWITRNRILKSKYFKKYDMSNIRKMYLSGAIVTSKRQIMLKEYFLNADVIQIYSKMKMTYCDLLVSTETRRKVVNECDNFIIQDNILKGKEEPLSTEYTNIGKLLLDRMKAKPNFVGQIDVISEEIYTFAEMFDRTVKCALWLRQQGIKVNDVVAVCAPNIMDSFAPFFASFCVGAIFTPWNSAMDIREARYFMKLSGAKIVFAEENAVNTILEAAKFENYDIKVVVFGKAPNALPFSNILEGHIKYDVENFQCTSIDNVHDTAGLLYSSGTTGLPKGVRISHFALLSNVLLSGNFNTEGIPLWLSPYFWMTGVLLTLSSVVNYCRRLLYPTFEEEMVCKIIEKYEVTWMFLSSSMANRILKSGYFKKYDVSSISKLNISGAIFTANSQMKLKECFPSADIIQIFGMTEFCGIITLQKPHHKAGSIGTVRSNAQIKIVDLKTRCALGPNRIGELLGKSLTMMRDYYNNPEATKDTIDDDGWLHTGDLAYYDENGEFFIIDRLKEIIKYRGIQISPSEIENLLQTHPDVIEVAVVGIPHILDDEHPIAFVTKVPDSKVSERELQELVSRNMTDSYHLRGGVKFLEKMPYTASRKISRKDLKAMAKSYQLK